MSPEFKIVLLKFFKVEHFYKSVFLSLQISLWCICLAFEILLILYLDYSTNILLSVGDNP